MIGNPSKRVATDVRLGTLYHRCFPFYVSVCVYSDVVQDASRRRACGFFFSMYSVLILLRALTTLNGVIQSFSQYPQASALILPQKRSRYFHILLNSSSSSSSSAYSPYSLTICSFIVISHKNASSAVFHLLTPIDLKSLLIFLLFSAQTVINKARCIFFSVLLKASLNKSQIKKFPKFCFQANSSNAHFCFQIGSNA
jgi:hypothetical protein